MIPASSSGKYSAAWDILKRDKRVTLSIPLALRKRTIKGIIHAKDHDLVFKLECAQKLLKYKMRIRIDQAKVTITLIAYVDYSQICVSSNLNESML